MKVDVIIIGGGASGLMAGITAGRNKKKVVIIEHLDKVGKKILATGNGKCNYTNLHQEEDCYRGNHPSFVKSSLKQFSALDTIEFFKSIGIYPKNKQGYLYPNSEQASAVRDCLILEAKRVGVIIQIGETLVDIKKRQDIFYVDTMKTHYEGKNLIFATGLLAGQGCGCDGSAFPYIESFGHHFIDIVPALVQLKAKQSYLPKLAGIRSQVSLTIVVDGKAFAHDQGELLFTKYGLSGIVVMQVSRFASRGLKNHKKVVVGLNFLPNMKKEEIDKELEFRMHHNPNLNYGELLIGLIPYKLAGILIQEAKLDVHKTVANRPEIRQRLTQVITKFSVEITGTRELSDGQVCAGGIDTAEVDADTMMSKKISNLFFTGELLDIDGMCGGYNLQWAWASGYIAGQKVSKVRI